MDFLEDLFYLGVEAASAAEIIRGTSKSSPSTSALKWSITRKNGILIRTCDTKRRLYRIDRLSNAYKLVVHNHKGWGPTIGWCRVGMYNTLAEAEKKVAKMEA